MKTGIFRYTIALVLLASVLFTGCKKDSTPTPTPEPVVIPEASVVNSFIWNGMHDYYLWTSQVQTLNSAKYQNKDSLNLMLNKYTDPQKLFSSLLYRPDTIDKWSFMVDNSQTIDDWISGTSTTMGYDFMLSYIGSSNNLFGFVRYVYKGSPAEQAGLKRGDIFITVNNQQLTVSNYQSLLFNIDTYTLGFATITDRTISPNNKTMSMTAIEMQEDPINKDTIFTYNNQKVGYLVYNGFNADFDLELNDVFKAFKDANIDQLVVDLRYNGGGSVQSAIYLASMIYGTDETKVFAKSKYNTTLQNYLVSTYGDSYLNDNFTSKIAASGSNPETPINTLNMKKVYFIVSDNTASASELLINGLKPYANVVVVGINTEGKYTGSMTVKDWDSNGNVNPNDPYVMQPIIVKFANSLGVTDFINGLTPDINAEEDIANLLPFGDPNEKLLSYVLADMSGTQVVSQTLKSAQIGIRKIVDSQQFKPHGNEMYINPKSKNLENYKSR